MSQSVARLLLTGNVRANSAALSQMGKRWMGSLAQETRLDIKADFGIDKNDHYWQQDSIKLSKSFFEKYSQLSHDIFSTLSCHVNMPVENIITHSMDHLTYNVTTKQEAEYIVSLLDQRYKLKKVENLTFVENQVKGWLLWVPLDLEYSRKPGTLLADCGVQGFFVRYMTDDYLKQLGIYNHVYNTIDIINNKFKNDKIQSILSNKNYPILLNESEKQSLLKQRKDINKYFHSLLSNGIMGHFAIDIIALGSSLQQFEDYFNTKRDSDDTVSKEYSLFHNWNPKKTVRQLYVYPKEFEIKNFDLLREEPPECFFELIERDEVTSISAKKIDEIKPNKQKVQKMQ